MRNDRGSWGGLALAEEDAPVLPCADDEDRNELFDELFEDLDK